MKKDRILQIGNLIIDLNGFLGSLIPFALITSLLYFVIFKEIIPEEYTRFAVAFIAALFVEGFAIGVMTLEYRVSQFNRTLREGEVTLTYHAGRAKFVYMTIVIVVAVIGHIAPAIFHFDKVYSMVALVPMIVLAYFGYEMFSVNLAIKERLALREKLAQEQAAREAAERLRERGDQAMLNTQAQLQVDLAREHRLTEEAKAKAAQAEARKAKAEHSAPVSPGKAVEYQAPSNGFDKPWEDMSFGEIEGALQEGRTPPKIHHLPTWSRYQILRAEIGANAPFRSDIACNIAGVNTTRLRKDLHLLAAHGLVEEIERGTYQFKENNPKETIK